MRKFKDYLRDAIYERVESQYNELIEHLSIEDIEDYYDDIDVRNRIIDKLNDYVIDNIDEVVDGIVDELLDRIM